MSGFQKHPVNCIYCDTIVWFVTVKLNCKYVSQCFYLLSNCEGWPLNYLMFRYLITSKVELPDVFLFTQMPTLPSQCEHCLKSFFFNWYEKLSSFSNILWIKDVVIITWYKGKLRVFWPQPKQLYVVWFEGKSNIQTVIRVEEFLYNYA